MTRAFSLARAVCAYALAGWVHELAHLVALWTLGVDARALDVARALAGRHVAIDDATMVGRADAVVVARWVGFFASVAAALGVEFRERFARRGKTSDDVAVRVAFWATSLDSLCADVLDVVPGRGARLLCGNFGIILINAAWAQSEGPSTTSITPLAP